MISDALALLKYLKEQSSEINVFSALFSYTGEMKSGDEIIKIKLNKVKDNVWFYEILPYGDYVFIPFPVNPAVYADYGLLIGHSNPTTNHFRYVSSPMSHYSADGEANLEVDFMVFGYQPKELLARMKKTS